MNNSKAIISTGNTLEALGLQKLLNDVFDIGAHIVDANYFDVLTTTTEPDLFFVDQDTLVAKLSFFLPRKAKTVVLTTGEKVFDDIRTISASASHDQLINTINSMLETHKEDEKACNALSSREIEVLRLIASGKINKEIAQELNISINTVLSHRKNITAKLGIKSVSGLSFYAMMNGII
jgi:DNA-binding CsgD family transcriptional regulator